MPEKTEHDMGTQQAPPGYQQMTQGFRQAPYFGQLPVKSSKGVRASSIVLMVLGLIVCFPSLIAVTITTMRPDSTGAFYTLDLSSLVSFSPVYSLICGACYVVAGIIAFSSIAKPGGGNIKTIGIVFPVVYIIIFIVFVSMFPSPAFSGIIIAGLIIAIICGVIFILGDKALKEPRINK